MIGLDTNVLVRYLIQDDAEQAAKATPLLEDVCTRERPGLINLVVLCELVWVLSRSYRFAAAQIAATLEKLFQAAELEIEDADTAWAALRLYKSGQCDLADAVIGHRNRRAGCITTATFDAAAAANPAFSSVASVLAEKSRLA